MTPAHAWHRTRPLRRGDDAQVGVLTAWDCEAGTTYIPGEPDEYDEDAQLVGYLHPETFEYVALDA